jgi:hypothetical protein
VYYNPSALIKWDAFIVILHHAIDLYVPVYKISLKKVCCDKPCKVQSKQIRTYERKKRQLWRKMKRFPYDALTRSKYRKYTFEWRQLVTKGDRDREEPIIDSNDLGSFYKYINGRIGRRSSIDAIHDADKIIDTDKEKANVFNSNFSSAGVADNGLLPLIAIRFIN